MQISPKLVTARFGDTKPGDLCVASYFHDKLFVSLVAEDRRDGDKLILLLGPTSEDVPEVPYICDYPSREVVSIAKDYELRLPHDAKGWMFEEPPREQACLVLAENKLYFRAFYGWAGQKTQCYIDAVDGQVLKNDGGRFMHPAGTCAYALAWSLWTTEKEPREILGGNQR